MFQLVFKIQIVLYSKSQIIETLKLFPQTPRAT